MTGGANKARKRKLGGKGMTLVEMVVAMCVASILFASMISVMSPVYRIYARTRARTDAQLVAGVVLDSIRAACTNAQSLTVDGSALVINGKAEFSENGGLLYFDSDNTDANAAALALGSGVYNGKTITGFALEQAGNDVKVTITVTDSQDAGASCTLTSQIGSMHDVLVP